MPTKSQYLDLDWLRKQECSPYYFGLGWIQLKLSEFQRLHFWCPTIEGTGLYEEDVHDHRYSFHSEILYGTMEQELYSFEKHPAGAWKLFETDCKPLVPGTPIEELRGNLTPMITMQLQAGDSYNIDPNQFHRIRSTECVTLLNRGHIAKPFARVVKPLEAKHQCPFELTMSSAVVWGHLEAMLHPLRLCNDPAPVGISLCGEFLGHRGDHRTEDGKEGWHNSRATTPKTRKPTAIEVFLHEQEGYVGVDAPYQPMYRRKV